MNVSRPSRRSVLLGALGLGAGMALDTALPLPGAFAASPSPQPPLLVCDQKRRKVLLLDSAKSVWDPDADPDCVQWSFTPEGNPDFSDLNPQSSWTYVSEAKARTVNGRVFVLVAASYGFAGVVDQADGSRYWGGMVAGVPSTADFNPHSIELLGNGNVAVAASAGNQVRLYAASQSPSCDVYASAELEDAHGLHWDAPRGLLWAVGKRQLVAYSVGAAASPALTPRVSVDLPRPSGGGSGPYGHDLFAVQGSSDLLWVTTAADVFRFSLAGRTFVRYAGGGSSANLTNVKSISNNGNDVVFTSPDGTMNPSWWTRHVRRGTGEGWRLDGGGIYKARWWQP